MGTSLLCQLHLRARSLKAGLPGERLCAVQTRPFWNTAHCGQPPDLVHCPSLYKFTVSSGTPKHCKDSRYSKHQLEMCNTKVQSSCSLIWTEASEEHWQNSSHLERFHTYAFSWAASSALETFL